MFDKKVIENWMINISVVIFACMFFLIGCGESSKKDSVKIGVIAAYSGKQASTGFNFEKALILAQNQINDNGGLAGKDLEFVFANTHSDGKKSIESVKNLIENEDIIALIGPNDLSITKDIAALTKDANLLHVLPGIANPDLLETEYTQSVFSLGPSSGSIGCAFIEHIYDKEYRNIAVIHSANELGVSTATNMVNSAEEYQRPTSIAEVTLFEYEEGSNQYETIGQEVMEINPDAVVFIIGDLETAEIVRQWPQLETPVAWFLGPNTLSRVLLDNSPPNFFEGAQSVELSVVNQDRADEMSNNFEEEYDDSPYTLSYYYYDAIALLSLAIESYYVTSGEDPKAGVEAMADSVQLISRAPGTRIYWNNLNTGLELIRTNKEVDYHGITGPLTVGFNNKVDQTSAFFDIYDVKNNTYSSTSSITCL